MKEFSPAKRHVEVAVGESVRILREFQELSQNDLADISGIPQSTISAIETTASVWAWKEPRHWRGR